MSNTNYNIFKSLDESFIQKTFHKKINVYFPALKNKKIKHIEIKRTSPNWAKESCLVRYEILFDNDTKKIVRGAAKTKKSGKSAWQIMKHLYCRDFNSGNLQIAKPLDYIADIDLLLYEEAPGVTMNEIIEKETKTVIEKNLKDVARWLVKLHNLDFKKEKFPKAAFIGFNGYKNIFHKIKKYIPELKNDLIPLNKIEFVNQIWKSKKKFIHNDFYPGNSISNKKIIFGIDFDRAGVGPFLMDIATFYGALEFPKELWGLKISKRQVRYFQDIFLREYCKSRELNYLQTKKDLKKFLVKIFLDQIHNYATGIIRYRNLMDEKTKDSYVLRIKTLLLKINENL